MSKRAKESTAVIFSIIFFYFFCFLFFRCQKPSLNLTKALYAGSYGPGEGGGAEAQLASRY